MLLLLMLAPGRPTAAEEDSTPFEQRKDVLYGEVHGTGLLMDVFVPRGKTNGLGIVDVASGAWHSDRSKIRDHTLAQIYHIHCARGYTVFAVRPGSKTRYTVAEMDANLKTAVRFIKEHAREYNIDPQRLGLTGASAGGHLALLAALTPSAGRPDSKRVGGKFGPVVRAVVVFFPPTDLIDWDEGRKADPALVASVLYLPGVAGKSETEMEATARKASPLHQVAKSDVPFLIFHGDADKVVPLYHSRRFVESMREKGNSVELIVKEGGGHPWLTLPEEVRLMADWFDKQLRP